MHRGNRQGFRLKLTNWLLSGFALILIAGCATTSRIADPTGDEFDTVSLGRAAFLLEDGESTYLGFSIIRHRDVYSWIFLQLSPGIHRILARVDGIVGSLDLASNPVGFRGVALGRFPERAVRFSLWRDRGFKRIVARVGEERVVYYREIRDAAEIGIPESGTILVSTSSVLELTEHYWRQANDAANPDPLTAAATQIAMVGTREGPDLLLYLADPESFLTGRLGVEIPAFPISGMTVSATAIPVESLGTAPVALQDRVLVLGGSFQFQTEMQARLFARLGRGFVLGLMRGLGVRTEDLRDSLSIESSDTVLSFDGIRITAGEFAGVISRLAGIPLAEESDQ